MKSEDLSGHSIAFQTATPLTSVAGGCDVREFLAGDYVRTSTSLVGTILMIHGDYAWVELGFVGGEKIPTSQKISQLRHEEAV